MPKISGNTKSTTLRRIAYLVYPGFELLDLSGPAAVFAHANTVAGETLYQQQIYALEAGQLSSGAGFAIETKPLTQWRCTSRTTVLVCGAEVEPLRAAMAQQELLQCIKRAHRRAERLGSICSGAFVLGAAGVLDGVTAVTHWSATEQLAALFPKARVQPDALYCRQGSVWTSAGVTTGIDMALAMLQSDHGVELKSAVAKRLVVYAHRPGNQSQFSLTLQAQSAKNDRFDVLIAWIGGHLEQALTLSRLAAIMGMSERSFQRKFSETLGIAPGKYVERTRMQRASELLCGNAAIKSIAGAVGYRSEASFRSAFAMHFGVAPGLYRRLHGGIG